MMATHYPLPASQQAQALEKANQAAKAAAFFADLIKAAPAPLPTRKKVNE